MTTEIVILGVDTAGMRTQVAPVGSGTSRNRPPEAIRRTCVEVAIGKVVVASTQELERPRVKQSGRHETLFHAQQAISLLALISNEMSSELNINTIVVGGAGVAARPGATQAKSVWGPKQQSSILQHLPLSTPPPAFAEAPPHTLPSLASPPFLPLTPGYTFHLILSS